MSTPQQEASVGHTQGVGAWCCSEVGAWVRTSRRGKEMSKVRRAMAHDDALWHAEALELRRLEGLQIEGIDLLLG